MLRAVRKLLQGWLEPSGPPASAPAQPRAQATAGATAALFETGLREFRVGRYEEAERAFERVLQAEPDNADAHLNLGLTCQRLGRLEDAADSFQLALVARPDFAEAHFNRGVVALERGGREVAARSFESALAARPDYPEALSNLGYVQTRLGQAREAERNLRRAVALRPAFGDAWCNLGLLLQDEGRFDEALATYAEALRHDPGQQEARLNRALLQLAREDYAHGWAQYEARKHASGHFHPRAFPWPEWDGAPAPDATVLVYGEQGLGDEIMFASCIPDVMARVGRCVIECSPKLEALFRRSFAPAIVVTGPQTNALPAWVPHAPPIDRQIAAGSLPRHFRPARTAFPRESYLRADPAKVARWKARLEALGAGPRVGLSWRGGTARTHRDRRSISLDELLPLLHAPGLRFVSLQYTDCHEELARLRARHGITIEHWQEAIDDYDETAALVSALDAVVSVQTAIVHLAGALGARVWAMVPSVPEWRYLHRGEELPWYSSLRVLRQPAPNAWLPVIERVAMEVCSALAPGPEETQRRFARALTHAQAGEYAPAAAELRALLAQDAGHAEAWNALGNIHKLERRWLEAIECYERAIGLEPRLYSALSNLGVALRNQGRTADALPYLERATALAPDRADIAFNRALGLIDSGREEEGEAALERTLALEPEMAEAHFARGCQLLAAGRFAEGWREYEWRTRAEDWERRNAEAALPWWQGETRTNATLLVRAEQGLGDQIMFASCLPDLLAQRGRCVIECDGRLQALFRRSFPSATVVPAEPAGAWRNAARAPDVQVNLGSLPRWLVRDSIESFPRHTGYLQADPARVQAWRERLAQLGAGPRIGVSWRGGTWNTRQLARSLPLAALAPLMHAAPGAWVSLQYGDCAAEIHELQRSQGIELTHWPDALGNYEETAALVAALDQVVSVQTAVVHLAGALGRPVWVMVPARAEWRYMRSGEGMPWYPAARLFRQHAAGDWPAVVGRVADQLARWPGHPQG